MTDMVFKIMEENTVLHSRLRMRNPPYSSHGLYLALIFVGEDVKGAVTDMVVKIMEEDPSQHAEAVSALESVFKDLGESPFTIKVSFTLYWTSRLCL
jgi:hypothetical protein